jgi:glycosyltransferase involved in cell wall biosynthesis
VARICLITAHHVSFQPRTLREADSLCEAGHDVRVVCRQQDPMLTEYDREIMKTRAWRMQPIDLSRNGHRRRAWLVESLRAKTYRRLFDAGLKTDRVGTRGYVRGFDQLLELAISESADWFIAHTQAALPIGAEGANHWNAKLGFDCEDLLAESGTDPADIVNLIQQRYLSLCDYVSVPSKCLGDRLARDYAIPPPRVLYNVSPAYLAEGLIPPMERPPTPALRLHWFGQTIGEGRGVEEAIASLGLLAGAQVELHLRGRVDSEFRSKLEALSRQHGAVDKVFFHPTVPPAGLIREMEPFDVGLALERADHGNYSLTVTNKLFSYLLAGLAVAATDTPGHREVMEGIPATGFLYDAGNPGALANGLQNWIADRERLRAAQQAAWNAARERFCWDKEKEKFFNLLEPSAPGRLKQTA